MEILFLFSNHDMFAFGNDVYQHWGLCNLSISSLACSLSLSHPLPTKYSTTKRRFRKTISFLHKILKPEAKNGKNKKMLEAKFLCTIFLLYFDLQFLLSTKLFITDSLKIMKIIPLNIWGWWNRCHRHHCLHLVAFVPYFSMKIKHTPRHSIHIWKIILLYSYNIKPKIVAN